MKMKWIVVVVLVLMFTGCDSEQVVNTRYGYTVYKEDFESCATALEIVGQDGIFEYYFPCLESQYYTVVDEEGNEYSAKELYEQDLLSLQQIYELFDGNINRMERFDVVTSITECPVTIPEEQDVVGMINGYEIIRTNFACEAVVGDVFVDGYYFGFIYSGCDGDIDDIGYRARFDGDEFLLSDMIELGEMTVEEIYNLYICDEGKIGQYLND